MLLLMELLRWVDRQLILLLLLLHLDGLGDLKLTVCLDMILRLLLWQGHGRWHHR